MTEFLFCFSCCIGEQPQPRRRRIDRSMIGEPMNFVHTAHIGSGESNAGFAMETSAVSDWGTSKIHSGDLRDRYMQRLPVHTEAGRSKKLKIIVSVTTTENGWIISGSDEIKRWLYSRDFRCGTVAFSRLVWKSVLHIAQRFLTENSPQE